MQCLLLNRGIYTVSRSLKFSKNVCEEIIARRRWKTYSMLFDFNFLEAIKYEI